MTAMYEPLGEGHYRSTEHTQGPWDPAQQHMGPVTALLVHELEQTAPRPGLTIAQLSVDVFSPVPIAELQVSTSVARDGKRVQCLDASVSTGGRICARARAWRIRESDTASAATQAGQPPTPLPAPGQQEWDGIAERFGYGRAMDWRFVRGSGVGGPATAWGRVRIPIIDGEETTPLQRVAVFADSGNGISSVLDFATYLFVNVDLSINLFRAPSGEWICMDAATTVGPGGRGLARTTLYDTEGEIGSSTQTLFVAPRD